MSLLKSKPKTGSYQSFEPGSGSSDSHARLAALRLPDLSGMNILDLGCNEGFFCFAALERGAAHATGIDRLPDMIASAKSRAETSGVSDRTRFVNAGWETFDEKGFDIIFLLSALHYAKDQAAFLKRIAQMLVPGGKLILEGGIIENPKSNWTSIIRGNPPHTDIVEYPTQRYMFEMLSENFAPREKGPSILQPGGNVPRYVWHCEKLEPMILAVGAPPFGGKTTLAFALRRKGIPLVDIDVLIWNERDKDTALGRVIAPVFQERALHLSFEAIVKAGLYSDLAELVFADLATKPFAPTTTVTGMALCDASFLEAFVSAAKRAGFRMWNVSRPSLPATR